MNKLFDQFLLPEEDVSWDNNVDDLDSFNEINSEGVSHDYDDNRETEVFDTSSSVSEYEPDSTTHLPKKLKLPQDKTDSHSFAKTTLVMNLSAPIVREQIYIHYILF